MRKGAGLRRVVTVRKSQHGRTNNFMEETMKQRVSGRASEHRDMQGRDRARGESLCEGMRNEKYWVWKRCGHKKT